MQFELDKLLESVSRDKNIDRAILVDTLEQAILSAARKVFGANRQLEARYNAETGTVELFLILTISETTNEPGVSCSYADAKAHGLEAEVGDEILFQIFYHPTEEKKAIEQEKQFGKLLNLKDYRKTFGGSPPRPPSRSSFSASAPPSAKRSTRSSRTASATSSTASCAGSRRATSSSTSAGPRRC